MYYKDCYIQGLPLAFLSCLSQSGILRKQVSGKGGHWRQESMERLEGGPRNKSEAVKCALEKCVGVLLSFLLPHKSLDEVISLQTKGSEDSIPSWSHFYSSSYIF